MNKTWGSRTRLFTYFVVKVWGQTKDSPPIQRDLPAIWIDHPPCFFNYTPASYKNIWHCYSYAWIFVLKFGTQFLIWYLLLFTFSVIPAWYFRGTASLLSVFTGGGAGSMCSVWAFTRTAIQAESRMDAGGVNDLPHIVCDRGTAGRLRRVPRLFWGLAKHRWQLPPADTTHISKLATEFRHRSVQAVSFSRGLFPNTLTKT